MELNLMFEFRYSIAILRPVSYIQEIMFFYGADTLRLYFSTCCRLTILVICGYSPKGIKAPNRIKAWTNSALVSGNF